MNKFQKNKKIPKALYLIITLSLLIVIGSVTWTKYFSPSPASIDVVSSLQYGPVELEGIVQKDAPIGKKEGTYILVTPSSNLLVLDQKGLDQLVGRKVLAKGIMAPPSETSGDKNILVLSSLEALP